MTPPPTHGYSTAELELADRARAGDQQAMARLYEQYAPRLYVHAVRMLGDEAAARDAVQEAFVKALSAISRTREELKFRAWIYRIVTNHCLRQLNVRQRWSGREVPEPEDHAGSPEADLRRAESAAQVMEALEELPPRYRQMLVLRELDGLSYEDLARVLESDVSRVRVTLHRARARLSAVFIARRLRDDPPAAVECPDLAELLDRAASHELLVKHLEACPRCRQRRHRPAVELLGLLPAVEPADLSPPAELSAATAAGQGSMSLLLKALAPLLLGGAALVAGTLAVMDGDPEKPGEASRPARHIASSRSAGVSNSRLRAPGSGLRLPEGANPPPKAATGATVPGPAKKGRTAGKSPGSARPRRPRTGPAHRLRPLAVKLQFTPGTLEVRRGARTLVPGGPGDLRLGDVLRGKAGASYGLWLPRRQWLIVQGTVRLDAVPYKKAKPLRVDVTLLRGQVRVRATDLGGGVAVRAGAVRCEAPRGRFRVRINGAAVRVESLDAYVSVKGPHAGRTVSPATGLDLGDRPGFAHRLPPAPVGLRPVQACARRPPRLSWRSAPGARGYRLQVARDTDFMDLRLDLPVSGSSASPGKLEPGKYYWRVLASDGTRQGLPSKIYGFTISETCPGRK